MSKVQDLIKCILAEGKPAIAEAQGKEILPSLFSGPDQAALQFVYDYWRDYGAVVPRALLEMRTGIDFSGPPVGASGFVIDEIQRARTLFKLGEGTERLATAMQAKDTEGAFAALEQTYREVRSLKKDRIRPVSLPSNFRNVLAHHDKMAAGHRGVLTPWPTMNDFTYGFNPTDFVLFVARLGVGKTWSLLILLLFAWVSKKRVLIATTEMDQLRMSLRVLALQLRIPPDLLRKGRLGPSRGEVETAIAELENQPGMYMVGGGSYRLGFENIESAAEEIEPHLILLDGAYLLEMPEFQNNKGKRRSGKDGRFDKAAEIFEECKQFNLRMKVPVIATTQFNRQARRNSLAGAEVENIALSDTAGWAADYIFALLQTDDMQEALEMIVKPLKTREGGGKEFMIRWDIDRGDFQEIPHTRLEGGAHGGGASLNASLSGADPFSKPAASAQKPNSDSYADKL